MFPDGAFGGTFDHLAGVADLSGLLAAPGAAFALVVGPILCGQGAFCRRLIGFTSLVGIALHLAAPVLAVAEGGLPEARSLDGEEQRRPVAYLSGLRGPRLIVLSSKPPLSSA